MLKKISILAVLFALTFALTADFASAQLRNRGPRYAGPVDRYDYNPGQGNSVQPGQSKMNPDGGDISGNTGGYNGGCGEVNGRVVYRSCFRYCVCDEDGNYCCYRTPLFSRNRHCYVDEDGNCCCYRTYRSFRFRNCYLDEDGNCCCNYARPRFVRVTRSSCDCE